MKPQLFGYLIALLLASPVLADAAPPQTQAEQRNLAVARTVLDILSYSRWPVAPFPLRLCVAAPTEYADALLQLDKAQDGTPIESRRIGLEEHGLEQECDLLYLGVLSPELRQMMARRLGEAPVLTIEENNPECALGGIFCLGIRDSRGGFSVNLDSLARSGIRIHPAVLRLSRPRGE